MLTRTLLPFLWLLSTSSMVPRRWVVCFQIILAGGIEMGSGEMDLGKEHVVVHKRIPPDYRNTNTHWKFWSTEKSKKESSIHTMMDNNLEDSLPTMIPNPPSFLSLFTDPLSLSLSLSFPFSLNPPKGQGIPRQPRSLRRCRSSCCCFFCSSCRCWSWKGRREGRGRIWWWSRIRSIRLVSCLLLFCNRPSTSPFTISY